MMLGVFTGSMSDLCFQHGGSFRAAVAKNQRGSGRILRTIPVLSHHKYTYLKNNARSSYTCISLCERFTVSGFCCCFVCFFVLFFYLLIALAILQGGLLMQEEAYIRTGHFLWKALKFFLSVEPKSWILILSS